jgi:hypothetical protein
MSKSENIKEAHDLISGRLYLLPTKQWKTLSDYRNSFSYVQDQNIKEQLSNFNLALDYQLSLYYFHKPIDYLEETSFLTICYLIGTICEALLRDLYFYNIKKIPNDKFVDSFLKNYSGVMFGPLLKMMRDLINQDDYVYLDRIKKLRNTIHINTKDETLKILDETNHIIIVKVKDFFTDGYEIKKMYDFKKLEEEFSSFIVSFKKYY